VVVLIWVYVIACSAFKNAQTEDLFRRYKQGWVWSWSHTHPTFQMLVLDPLFNFFFSPLLFYPSSDENVSLSILYIFLCALLIYKVWWYGPTVVEHTFTFI
jgi:hypothetical protein